MSTGAAQPAAVRGGVDAEREARDDGEARVAERLAKLSALRSPCAVALRLPTIASAGRAQQLGAAAA